MYENKNIVDYKTNVMKCTDLKISLLPPIGHVVKYDYMVTNVKVKTLKTFIQNRGQKNKSVNKIHFQVKKGSFKIPPAEKSKL